MAIQPKAICTFNAIPMKMLTQSCIDLEKTIFSFIWKHTPSPPKKKKKTYRGRYNNHQWWWSNWLAPYRNKEEC